MNIGGRPNEKRFCRLLTLQNSWSQTNLPPSQTFHRTSLPFWDSTGKRYIYNLVTKERLCDKPNLSTLSKTLEAMKIHASTNGVSTIAISKLGCALDQMNWQEVVKLLHDIFVYADVQIVVKTLEEMESTQCPLKPTLSSILTMR